MGCCVNHDQTGDAYRGRGREECHEEARGTIPLGRHRKHQQQRSDGNGPGEARGHHPHRMGQETQEDSPSASVHVRERHGDPVSPTRGRSHTPAAL